MNIHRLRLARLRAGLTQSDVEKKLGKPPTWLSHMETNKMVHRNFDDIVKLCRLYGIETKILEDGYDDAQEAYGDVVKQGQEDK